jgi:general secretion pathway protein K
MTRSPTAPPQRGAALLIAMLVLTLVSTVAAGMVWHQHRAIEVEAAERARSQAAWMIDGGFDWVTHAIIGPLNTATAAFPFVFEDGDVGKLIAADRDNNADSELKLYVAGRIDDGQAKYNLYNLLGQDGKPSVPDVETFRRLGESIGLGADLVARISDGALASWGLPPRPDAALPLRRPRDLSRLGIDAPTIAVLERFVTMLPSRTPVNASSAPREVLAAVVPGLDLASAERIVRQKPKDLTELTALLPAGTEIDPNRVGIGTRFFEIQGELRYEKRVLRERILVERAGNQAVVLRRERESLVLPATP